VIICDTAGRLAIDAELMDEVRKISEVLNPHYTFLVVDAMTGQDAVTVAESFHSTLALDGVILTKLDGDARGGAALSVKEVVGRPIAFASTGENIDEFETFYPDRLASRILGMGDIETLIEKAEAAFEEEEAEIAAQRLMDGTFTLDDFLQQMQQIKKMGPLGNLIGMMPGMPKEVRDVEIEDSQVNRLEAIIRSMTIEERAKPEIIDGSRRQRIANGSGMKPQDVSSLVKQFGEMQKMMKQLGMTPKKPKRKGSGGKNKRGRGGGRTTPKGGVALGDPAAVLAEEAEKYAGLTLPGLDE
jgi:signal recognition particle subunit SRP54